VKKLSDDFPTDASKYIFARLMVLRCVRRRQPIYTMLVFLMPGFRIN